MLPKSEFRSIWEVAHNWNGLDPDKATSHDLSEELQDTILRIIWAYFRKKISLRKIRLGRSWRILDEDVHLFLIFFNLNRDRVRLLKAARTRQFDREFFSGVYILRPEILRWCEDEYLDPPPLWQVKDVATKGNESKPSKRHRDSEIDKHRCQAIAATLWDIDPTIHPTHMARSRAIQIYGNAKHYTDPDTVKNWLAEVNPQRKQRKLGRPPANSNYKIDLKIEG